MLTWEIPLTAFSKLYINIDKRLNSDLIVDKRFLWTHLQKIFVLAVQSFLFMQTKGKIQKDGAVQFCCVEELKHMDQISCTFLYSQKSNLKFLIFLKL